MPFFLLPGVPIQSWSRNLRGCNPQRALLGRRPVLGSDEGPYLPLSLLGRGVRLEISFEALDGHLRKFLIRGAGLQDILLLQVLKNLKHMNCALRRIPCHYRQSRSVAIGFKLLLFAVAGLEKLYRKPDKNGERRVP